MDPSSTPSEAEQIEALNAELAAMADSAAEAEQLLGKLASALFPGGAPDLRRLTWPDTPDTAVESATGGGQTAPPDEQSQTKARLRAAEARYRTLVEQIPAVTFMAVLGEGENEIYVSPHIEALLGFTQKEWLDNPFLWFSQLHPDDRTLWNEEFARGCRTGGPFRAECRFIARDGRVVWVRGEARVVKDELGRPLFLQGVAFDITEAKRAEALVLAEAVRSTEERYRDLVQGLGAVVWEAEGAPYRFSFVSHHAETVFGFPPKRWLEDSQFWPERIHPDDRARLAGQWSAAIERGLERTFEYRVTAADGRVVWVHDTVRIIRDEAGRVRHLLGVMVDITERKHAEEDRVRLLARERQARAESEILNRVGRLLAAELDFEKLAQAVTDAGTQLTGAQFGALFVAPKDAKEASYVLSTIAGAPREAFAGARPLGSPLEAAARRDGIIRLDDVTGDPRSSARWLIGTLPVRSYLEVPVVSRSGDVLARLVFGHPEAGRFTERHERLSGGIAAQAAISMDNALLYRAAEDARRVAEEANRAKDEFLATMSHELRTPLNAVLGWAHMLRTARFDAATATRALEAIERNAKAQAELVDDVLDVSRIITGKLHLQVAPVDLGMVVDAALDAVRLAAQAKGIDLQIAIDSTIGLVTGDASRLQQVVWNLLSNAIKFTPAGGRVEIRVERTETAARIVVSDTGRGIEPKFLPYVFDRFRQADSTSTRAHGGLGLGLAIVRHLVELHGGEVRAESAGVGSGATFIVELPLGPSGAALAERTAELPDPHGPRPLSGVRILVVDDERETRELLTVVLKQAGAYVHTVDGASEAFRALEAARPAILLCDIAMPAIDGYTLIRQLRAQGCHVPAVAVTAYGRGEDRGQALAAGFQAYLAKPVDPVDLIGVIAGLVRTAAA